MRFAAAGIAALGLVVLVVASSMHFVALAAPSPADATINMENSAFSPTRVTITQDSSVTWVNKDPVPHTATADDGTFDEALLEGESASVRFGTLGTFSFYCRPHPWMTGSVVVVEEDPDTLPETGDSPAEGLPLGLALVAGSLLLACGVWMARRGHTTAGR